MRNRYIKGAPERLAKHPKVVQDPFSLKGSWHTYFGNEHPIMIEIGMGKGQFITRLARQNPHINYIGFEKTNSIVVKALEKIDGQEDLPNLVIVCEFAEKLLDLFEEGELSGIYLNFSDPWPKERHDKRRLTYKSFLEKYNRVLKPGSTITFKTDNPSLFEFSINQIKAFGLELLELTEDLHNSTYVKDNVMTEYEEKFVALGMKIHMVKARTLARKKLS